MLAPTETLLHIRDQLADSVPPAQIVEEMAATTPAEAMTWARHLTLWDEHRDWYSAQTIAVARLISKRAMREFGLAFDPEGRVVAEPRERSGNFDKITSRFPLTIGEETIEVRFTHQYFSGQDLFSFVGEQQPVSDEPHIHKPHPLSESGWLSQFVSYDITDACGGPEGFARLFADAKVLGEDEALLATFEGKRPEEKPTRRKRKLPEQVTPGEAEPKPIIGEHTEAVVKEREPQEAAPARQQTLFE